MRALYMFFFVPIIQITILDFGWRSLKIKNQINIPLTLIKTHYLDFRFVCILFSPQKKDLSASYFLLFKIIFPLLVFFL